MTWRHLRFTATWTLALALHASVWSADLHAALAVGDAVEFAFDTIDGRKVSTKDLEGRIIIVEHWATWCGPCVAQVPHLKKLHEDYTPKGVVLIGVSHDNGPGVVEKFTADKAMTWPQVMLSNARGPDWGVRGIPHAFIISPDGKLLWRGHPGAMDQPLEQALKDHPPRMKKTTGGGDLTATLKAANAAIDRKDIDTLLDAIATLPDESFEDKAVQARMKALARRVASPAVDQDKLAAALQGRDDLAPKVDKLKAMSPDNAAAATSTGAAKVSPAVVKVRMDKAVAAREKGEHIEAYRLYKWVAERAEGEEQLAAKEHVATYESDESFMAQLKRADDADAARALSATARSYADAGKKDLAIETFQKVIDTYPDTPEAKQAAQALAKLKR